MTRRPDPDPGTRVLVATIILIVVLAFATGGHAVFTYQPLPVTR